MAFNIGDTVGDYQIIGILGAGGMGKVYKVRNTISDRLEAMKVLLPDLANEPELADRFTREIKLLASLNHPNIAALHTALRLENQLLMVMEFVEGRTLEDRLKSGEGRLPAGEAVDTMIQVLAALGYAHERGVVHRDIKPANMMETPQGAVKLMDFGIAKAAADRRLTMTGTTLGSLYYMSPEQVKGSAGLDGRSDLYSVGVSFYELVTGTRPFRGDSDYSIMVAHLEQNPKPPIEIDPSLPPDLNEIIMTAIQKEPGNRFQTAQAFRAALESVRPTLASARPAAMRAAAAAGPVPGPTAWPAPAPIPTVPQQPAPAVPQAAAAWAQQAAPAAQAPAVPPPAASKSRRGLWMALGGLMVIAVLAAGALQLPRFFGTKASQSQAPAAAEAERAAPEAAQSAPAESAQPAPEAQAPASQPAPQATFEQPVQPPSPMTAKPAGGAVGNPPAAAAVTRRQTPAAPASRAAEQPPAAGPAQPAASSAPAPQPQADPAAMAAARERLRMMTSRANAASRSLKTLEAQQQASGVGLRGDISAAWDRVSAALEEARQAAKDGDAASAQRALDTAERDLDRLDKFLGR